MMTKQAIIIIDAQENHWLIPLCQDAVLKDKHQTGPVWAITSWEAGYYCSKFNVEIVCCESAETLISRGQIA